MHLQSGEVTPKPLLRAHSPPTAASASICATERRTLVNNMFDCFVFFFLLSLHINIVLTHIGKRSTRATFRLAVHCCVIVFHIILELNCRSSSSSSSSLSLLPPLPPHCFNPQHRPKWTAWWFSVGLEPLSRLGVFLLSVTRARVRVQILIEIFTWSRLCYVAWRVVDRKIQVRDSKRTKLHFPGISVN